MKRPLVLFLCVVAAVMIVMVAITVTCRQHARQDIVYSDGDTIHQPADAALLRQVLWQPPIELSQFINTQDQEYEPRLSADGQSLYFVRGKAGANADIYLARRLPGPVEQWSQPEPLAAINSAADELGPELSRDGQLLLFYSNRPGGLGGYDLWVSRRSEDRWQEPVNLGPAVNSEFNEYGPALSPDGSRLYFTSNRSQPGDGPDRSAGSWPATLREEHQQRDYDLYMATVNNGAAQSAVPLAALNTSHNEGAPAVSPAGDFLYFCSDRPGGHGGFDLYRTRILRGEILPPANLGLEVNSPANELDPCLDMGGFGLHFSSDRSAAIAGAESGDYNLFHTVSREVFIEAQAREPLIDWASLGALIFPSVLWLLLGLLALLALLALLKGVRSRRLSLLARCLLASLVAHLALMILLTFWQVTTSLAQAFERGGMKVSLTLDQAGDELAAQIRGGLTDVAVAPVAQSVLQAASALPVRDEAVMARFEVEAVAAPRREQSPIALEPADAAMPPPSVQVAVARPDPIESPRLDVTAPALATPVMAPEPPPVAPVVQRQTTMDRRELIARSPQVQEAPTIVAIAPAAVHSDDAFPVAEPFTPAPISDALPATAGSDAAADRRAVEAATISSLAADGSDVAVPSAQSVAMDVEPSAASAVMTMNAVQRQERAVVSPAVTSQHQRVRLNPVSAPLVQERQGAAAVMAQVAESTPVALENEPRFAAPRLVAPPGVPVDVALDTGATPAHEQAEPKAAAAAIAASVQRMPPPIAPIAPAIIELQPEPRGGADSSIDIEPQLAALPPQLPSERRSRNPGDTIALPNPAPALPAFAPLASNDLRIPAEAAPPIEQFIQRQEENRPELVQRMGGSEATERAVALALQWLASHQSDDGRWAAKKFDERCGACGGAAKFDTDIAATGLALLCFLAADHTHQKEGQYRQRVDRALTWLLAQQKADGDLRGGETMYSHAIAAIAISEAFAMTRDEKLAAPVRTAMEFICAAGNQRAGGWRYEPGQPGDTSVLGWQVMALVSAQRAGFVVRPEIFQMARKWLDGVSTSARPGLYAYQPGQPHSPSMTAEAMFVQQLLGTHPDQPRMQASTEYLLRNQPLWKKDTSTYYWYYATLAMFQQQGKPWEQWNQVLTEQLLSHQRTAGQAAGSWDPVDNWSKIGGRIYQTALCTLSLEVYYRYLPMYAAAGTKQAQR